MEDRANSPYMTTKVNEMNAQTEGLSATVLGQVQHEFPESETSRSKHPYLWTVQTGFFGPDAIDDGKNI